VAIKSDQSPNPSTVPRPELNPLLNPILNKNLGRWAEVYSTNPPEKRDEAVLQLLHELEQNGQSDDDPLPSLRPQDQQRKKAPAGFSSQADSVVCAECGATSSRQERFCGHCGARLSVPTQKATADAYRVVRPGYDREVRAAAGPQFGSILHLNDGVSPRSRDTNPLHDSDNGWGDEEQRSTPLWRSYRLYLGAVLAIILFVLGYTAYRGGQAPMGATQFPQQAPVAEANPPIAPAPSAANDNSAAATPANAPPASTSKVESTDAASPRREQTSAPAQNTNRTSQDTTASAEIGSGNGAQELALARDRLNGSNGKGRDSAQAAEWLWKAVAKKNREATVLLAGLYLRGDGVQKNCDQGRILLDAAANKGSKEAAELLRNLQAFGCQ
jgi:hypothetical protein